MCVSGDLKITVTINPVIHNDWCIIKEKHQNSKKC